MVAHGPNRVEPRLHWLNWLVQAVEVEAAHGSRQAMLALAVEVEEEQPTCAVYSMLPT